jgi:hypothetical protein
MGPRPDRGCSPGAYYPALTKAVLCSSSFGASSIREVSQLEARAVEIEYGMRPANYGKSFEIDHVVSLALGGSNDIANLFPERAGGYRAKDKLEHRLHELVCSGAMTLHRAQVGIATNWEALYVRIYGASPNV